MFEKRLKSEGEPGGYTGFAGFFRHLRFALWIALAVVVLAAGTVVCLALFTGTCRIQAVNFSGNRHLGADYLRSLSGISGYRNLVTLPVGRIEKNLESNPWIRQAKVQRHLLHTVNVKVEERRPLGVLDCSGTGFLVSSDGTVVEKIPLEQFPELPRVHGGALRPPTVGEKISDGKVNECLGVMRGMPESVRAILALGNPFDGRGPVFISRLGFNVVYGPNTEAKLKNTVLEAILADVKNNRRKISYIDLRVPEAPVIKPL